MIPPKPAARAGRVPLWRYLHLFRRDILSAQPARLYRAWMAEFRTPFFRSFLINEPDLVRRVLVERPEDFPKSGRVTEGLHPLLGDRSVFVTNGAEWRRQRRIIDPAFEGGRLRDTFPAMLAAASAAAARITPGDVEIEAETSHAAADVIFRTLFSLPIEAPVAAEVFERFRAYQRAQPLVNLAALVPLPWWVPRLHRPAALSAARHLRALIEGLVTDRLQAIARGTAPDDLATKILTARDPETGRSFDAAEMVDQVAIFFLAGHETSASAIAWTLYLLATHPRDQEIAAEEARDFMADPTVARLPALRNMRDAFREALRLYPPVPMMVRSAGRAESFRGRRVRKGDQIVVSPWHLHRQTRLWDAPDAFVPGRWRGEVPRGGHIPFSAGSRICPGAGFAMAEGVIMLAAILRDWEVRPVPGRVPVPVAHLTVRARDGIVLRFQRRSDGP